MDDTFERDNRIAPISPETTAQEDPGLRSALADLLANGEAWRFKDLAHRLRLLAGEGEVYRELRSLVRAGRVRRVRHGVYLTVGPYDWSAPVEAEAGVPVIQSAIYSQLHRLRTVDELRTVLGLPREVVWRSLRALIQSGAICTGEPMGVFREMTFIRRDRAGRDAAAAGGASEDAVDQIILAATEPGRLYSAHAAAAHADILVRTVKLALRKLSTVGTVRCFAYEDGLYFYRRAGTAPPSGRSVKPVDIYAELGAVNVATLDVIESAGDGLTASRVGRRLQEVLRSSRNTPARIITKLRRAGLVQMRDQVQASEPLWEATDIGSEVMALARGGFQSDGIAAPPAAEIRYDVGGASGETAAYRRLAEWILDTVTSADGSVRTRIPVNKRILARSLNISKPHLDRCFRLLAPVGVAVEGWDIVVSDVDALKDVLRP